MGLRTPGRFGPQRITCHVDESSGKTWVCDLHTTIHQRLRFDPPATHFGLLRPRTEHAREVTFLACAATEAEMPANVRFTRDSPQVTLGTVRVAIDRPASGVVVKRFTLPVKLVAPPVFGPASVVLTADLGDGKTKLTATVDWHVPETFLVSPRQVFVSANEAKAGGASKLAFAGTAMAEDPWPLNTGANVATDHRCRWASGPNGDGSCTHYTTACAVRTPDPSIDAACVGYKSLNRKRYRYYGTCTHEPFGCLPWGCSCSWATTAYCAELRLYWNSDCTNSGNPSCDIYVMSGGTCMNPVDAPANPPQ